jgi:hypothetical protein
MISNLVTVRAQKPPAAAPYRPSDLVLWPAPDIWTTSDRRLPSTNDGPAPRSRRTRDVVHSAHRSIYMISDGNLE